jgi:hypothetical protein
VNNSIKPDSVKIHEKGNGTYDSKMSALIDCIKQYPGQTEKWYADVMTSNSICARKTTLQIIRNLVHDGIINDNKIGNSFHRYVINHDSEYVEFVELLKEFQKIEDDFLTHFDKIYELFGNDPYIKLIEGTEVWTRYERELTSQLTILKALAVDVVGILLKIYREMMHRLDHIGDVDIVFELVRIIDVMMGYGKEDCFNWLKNDLNTFVSQTGSDTVEQVLTEKGINSDQLVTRLSKFGHTLDFKFNSNATWNSQEKNDRFESYKQEFIDNY